MVTSTARRPNAGASSLGRIVRRGFASEPAGAVGAPLESCSVTRLLHQLGKVRASTQNIPMTLRIDPGLRRLGLFLQPRSIAASSFVSLSSMLSPETFLDVSCKFSGPRLGFEPAAKTD